MCPSGAERVIPSALVRGAGDAEPVTGRWALGGPPVPPQEVAVPLEMPSPLPEVRACGPQSGWPSLSSSFPHPFLLRRSASSPFTAWTSRQTLTTPLRPAGPPQACPWSQGPRTTCRSVGSLFCPQPSQDNLGDRFSGRRWGDSILGNSLMAMGA